MLQITLLLKTVTNKRGHCGRPGEKLRNEEWDLFLPYLMENGCLFLPFKNKDSPNLREPTGHCHIKLCNWTPAERSSNQRDSIRHLSALSFWSLIFIRLSSLSPPQPHSKYQWWHPWHLSWNFKKATVYPLPSLQEHSPEWMLWNHTGFCCPLNTPQALVSAPTQPPVSTPSKGPHCTAGVPRERIYKLLLSYEISSSQSLGAHQPSGELTESTSAQAYPATEMEIE